jgi:hypothetical protein
LEGAADATTAWYVILCTNKDVVTAIALRTSPFPGLLISFSNIFQEAKTRNGRVMYAAGLTFKACVRRKRLPQ